MLVLGVEVAQAEHWRGLLLLVTQGLDRLDVAEPIGPQTRPFLYALLQVLLVPFYYLFYLYLYLLLLLPVLADHVVQPLRVRLLVLVAQDLLYLFPFELPFVAPALALAIEAPDHEGLGHQFLHLLTKVALAGVLHRVQPLHGPLLYPTITM